MISLSPIQKQAAVDDASGPKLFRRSGTEIVEKEIPNRVSDGEVSVEGALAEEPANAPRKETAAMPSVLLVDDDDVVRKFISTALTRLGYNVYEATHGEDGIEKYSELKDTIDVIVSDVLMPVLTGPEMVQKMRDAGLGPMRVLFVTGFPENYLSTQFTKDFPDARRLDKPFSVADLSKNVEDLLS